MQALTNTITKIEEQKRNKNRVNVFINGDFSFSCSTEIVFSNSLKPGKTVDLKSLREIVDEDSYIKGKNAALNIIEKSYKSEKEVMDKLAEKGYSEKIIERIIYFLKEYNFLNDKKFAEMYIKDKLNSQGKNKIKYALIRKGLPKDLIEEQLNQADEEIECGTALKLAEKKYNSLRESEIDLRKVYKKTGEFLVRNGFDSTLVKDILNKVQAQDEPEEWNDIRNNSEDIHELSQKRYNILIKSEKDSRKLYKKLGDYLLRKGFSWDKVKEELKQITKEGFNEE